MHTKHVSLGSSPLKPWSPVLTEKTRIHGYGTTLHLRICDDSRGEVLSTLAGVGRKKKVSKRCGGFKCGGQVTVISNVTGFVLGTWQAFQLNVYPKSLVSIKSYAPMLTGAVFDQARKIVCTFEHHFAKSQHSVQKLVLLNN